MENKIQRKNEITIKNLSTLTHTDKKFKIDLQKRKTFIKNNPDIFITRADKGNDTVIIKKSSYLEKLKIYLKMKNIIKKSRKIRYQIFKEPQIN